MLETVIAAILAYIGTNIDDIFIDALYFAQTDTKRERKSVMIGKYLGIGSLVLLSLLGAYGVQFMPQKYIGLLGLVPIALGVKEWAEYHHQKRDSTSDGDESGSKPAKGLMLNVMLVTMANGADNIGVYIPLFVSFTMVQVAAAVVIFALMTALWCFLGKKLADLPALRAFLLKYKYILVPVVLIALGVYIIAGSGLLE